MSAEAQVQVYHADEPTWRADVDACAFPEGFTLVATKARPAAETAAWLEWLSRPIPIPTPNGDL